MNLRAITGTRIGFTEKAKAIGSFARVFSTMTISQKVKDAAFDNLSLWTVRSAVAQTLVNLRPEDFSLKSIPRSAGLNLKDIVLKVRIEEKVLGTYPYDEFVEKVVEQKVHITLTKATVEITDGESVKGITFPIELSVDFTRHGARREKKG